VAQARLFALRPSAAAAAPLTHGCTLELKMVGLYFLQSTDAIRIMEGASGECFARCESGMPHVFVLVA
jgi:hypothetical protein